MQENFASLLEDNARRLGDRAALVWEGGSLTWAELEKTACGVARLLAEQGVNPGDRVAILIPNRWSFVVALLGALKLGVTAAPVSPDLKRDELAELLADLRPKRVVDEVKVAEGGWRTVTPALFPALIIYTSGSTGRPKGAVFAHRALDFSNRIWGGPILGLKNEDVVLGVLPFSHNYGLYAGLLAPLLYGASVAVVERFSPEAVLDAIERYRVTVFPGVATMFRRLLHSPAFSRADLSSLRLTVSGAAPCPWELCHEWREKTGTRILRGYGATEVPRPISYFSDDPTDFADAIGRPIPDTKAQVVDEEGRPLSGGEVGELWIQCPGAMERYLDAPEESREVLVDGWFRTGDLASVSPAGFVRIVGRRRERILRGGYSVFPQEVEAVLLVHPAVAEAAVVGIPSPDLGEEVAAFVTLKPKTKATAEELVGYCKERLAHFKFPRRVTVIEEMPKGALGKILKSELVKGRFKVGAP